MVSQVPVHWHTEKCPLVPNISCHWCSCDVSPVNLSLQCALKVLWILGVFFLPCDHSDQARSPQWWCLKTSRPFFIIKKMACYYGKWEHGVARMIKIYLQIRIVSFLCLDRTIFIYKASHLNTQFSDHRIPYCVDVTDRKSFLIWLAHLFQGLTACKI